MVKGKSIGEFGEIAPEVSGEFGIKSPIQAGEINLELVGTLIPDPVS
jgi:phenylalanyl-tRNA synthetase beta subunit